MRITGLAVAIGVAAASLPLGARQEVFRSRVDLVALDVSVRRQGQPAPDLTAADFEVRDNNVRQQVLDISRETLPIDVTLVVDLSESVAGPLLDSLTRAVDSVRRRLRPQDRATLATFTHRMDAWRVMTGAPAAGPAPVALGTPRGNTSLYDAMVVALIAPPVPDRRQMAIVFTDGYDTSSFLGETDVREVAARSGLTVFTVAVTDGTARVPQHSPDEAFFTGVAAATGGEAVVLQRDQDLGGPFLQAFENFRTSYVLRYTPAGVARAGWHDLSVKVLKAGRYEVRARKGYVGF